MAAVQGWTTPDIYEAYQVCQQITKREAKNFYYGFISLPEPKRHAIYAAYAFSRQCDDAVDGQGSAAEKLRALALAKQRLSQCYAGQPADAVTIALHDAVTRYPIPMAYFEALIEGMAMDIETTRYRTFEALRGYCYRAASAIGLICIEIFGYRQPQAKTFAIDLGIAMQLTNILRDLKEDAERGRIYLPQHELRDFGVSEADILAGRMNDEFRALMRYQTRRAHKYFASGIRLLPLLPPRSRMCTAVLQGLYAEILNRIEAANYDVYSKRISLSTLEKTQLTAWLWFWGFTSEAVSSCLGLSPTL
ncbi:MAG TPA: presqualene diphosphate synthase HpnD [Ktedonobacterales bacterium]|nr:presqualene diphosphate synthase HpnD [Ktedonobacterales bacterium]